MYFFMKWGGGGGGRGGGGPEIILQDWYNINFNKKIIIFLVLAGGC